MARAWRIAAIFLAAAVVAGFGAATSYSPHYVSLARDKVNMREGPSFKHRITWVYHRRGLPMRVLGHYDVWRHVEAADGTKGWVQGSMLSTARSVVVIGNKNAPVHDQPRSDSHVSVYLAPGVIARPQACKPELCEIVSAGVVGWVERKYLWGVDAGEAF
jgi:SH3-like domain-containing protein